MSKSLQLFPLTESDLKMILEWRNAPEVRANMYTTHEISSEEHYRWYTTLKNDKSKSYFVAKINNDPVGVIGFSDIDYVAKIAAWAFYLSPSAPMGSGAFMEYKALEHAFSELSLYKLRCEVLAFNQPVLKLHTKFGFKIEGTHRDAYFNGHEYHDIVHLGLFAHEWETVRNNLRKRLKLV